MNAQLDFYKPTLQQQFDAWVHTPEGGKIANLFIRLAIGCKRRGVKVGAGMIWERLRWQAAVRKHQPGAAFAYNNNWRAYLARLAMERVPELDGMFDLREVGKDRRKRKVIVIEEAA